ncbi:nucleotidyltransferase domain-containing protein [Salegentibacter sp. T436]|jgi:predicted nucleotidyltransferase|uniref:nucleotidyltransferase domain-containing protein n=1 Tax=Salegentibacter sp. T436 TaxID=1729720 RepID=UPI00094A283C|nr:nucleotidyltransferase domain-containing protein [Salegentibacter sp. T436]APS40367.1 DNA polymerase III subunit beta [Salegentibacter sp. T436]|tara:strand:+ start:625 stop:927 length:303 start_codon:yes stop_codon:yes gene_type:complete
MKEINQHIDQIKKLCDTNKVKSLFVFGSIVKDKLRPESDIDFVVDIDDQDPLSYSDKYFDLKFNLEKIFKRRIDLLELKAIKNKFLKQEIDQTKLHIYGE